MTLPPFPPCVLCASENTAFRGRYAHRGDQNDMVDLFYCLDCQSFASPRATPTTGEEALNWHLSVEERNTGYGKALFKKLEISKPKILDVGCGIGTLINVAKSMGGDGVGFDTDKSATDYGQTQGLDVRCEMWDLSTPVPAPNLITCIMVLEHIHWPRPLLHDLVQAAAKYDAKLFISVPWFNKNWWHYLSEPLEQGKFHALEAPRNHVTHMSHQGFERTIQSFGAKKFERINSLGWEGYLIIC